MNVPAISSDNNMPNADKTFSQAKAAIMIGGCIAGLGAGALLTQETAEAAIVVNAIDESSAMDEYEFSEYDAFDATNIAEEAPADITDSTSTWDPEVTYTDESNHDTF
ncbi:hypothetical protein QVA66_11805, partial [Staphylococcus chromogenes]|nr:hypothetical protein [Staphylococcus chromogenes]